MSKILYQRINFTIRLTPSFVFDLQSDKANCAVRLFMLSEVLRSFLPARLQKRIASKSIIFGNWEKSDSTNKIDHFHGTLYLPHVDANFVNLFIINMQNLSRSSKCFKSRGMAIRSIDIRYEESSETYWDFYSNKGINKTRLDRVFVDKNYSVFSAANSISQVSRSIAAQRKRFSV